MVEIFHLSKENAENATTFKELIKLYSKRDPKKYGEAIDKNRERYRFVMDEILATKVEVSEETVAA
jgi:hypothetical protein